VKYLGDPPETLIRGFAGGAADTVLRGSRPASAVRGGRDPRGLLEVELADVGLGEDERRAKQDGTVRPDGEAAELARGEGLPGAVRDLLGRVVDRRVRGQVTEIRRVPQLKGLDGAVSDELFMESGVPRPVSAILPRYLDVSRTCAAARIPTVVGEMMPLRFG